ncbi:LytR/AlgR family response regulator transcription factor [Tenacibaculum jejuense]|uniref:Two-component system response regulatory protein, LytTR family n=1 Tax=Tenacibaculum jejuense TaxID=584609 RepID=A0A238U5F9_9FLAO|nr:LytTR family DNA-binding domain-containing protein [Tenacibaculum jejuense]SNR14332.1 Two-component system response regulatory protein, LytTR family [Tenacibaculum jejuense]
MKILILEDEVPAYKKLLNYLNDFFEIEVQHDWARSIKDGRTMLLQNSYDFILSDIQLLDGISFDLFDEINLEAPIIFCSAHDEYLFKAFNTNGIAYILKPYTKLDFNKAIEKYKALFQKGDYNNLDTKIITELKSALKEEETNYKKRFVIKKSTGIQLLNVNEITLIEASGDFCIATDTNGKRHTISQNLSSILKQLNPNKFFKINRSEIISIDYIENIENHFKNRLLLTVTGCKEKPMTSTATTSEFRKWLES